MNFEVYGDRLSDPTIEINVKLAIVSEISDSIEIVHSNEYSKFLSCILPSFILLLSSIPPADFECTEHVSFWF